MRTFVAVEISDEGVIKKISDLQSSIKIKAKPVEPHNLHFTLQFLGEVSEEVSKKISQALLTIEFPSFKVSFQGLGVFPKPKFPRVIWIGTDDKGGEKLVELAKKVEKVLEPLGFKSDKPFRPHVTIFRIKSKIGDITKDLEELKNLDFGIQEIKNFKFKQSVLQHSGPVYSDIKVVELK